MDLDVIARELGIATEAPAPTADPQAVAMRQALGMEREYRGDETDPDDDDVDPDDDEEGGDEDDERDLPAEGRKPKAAEGKQETETDIQAQITALRAELDAAKAEAEKGGSLRQLMNQDPARFAQALLGSMNPQARAQVLGAYGAGNAQEAVSALERRYQELGIEPDTITPAERFLFEQHDTITALPEKLQNLTTAFDAELDTLYEIQQYHETVLQEVLDAIGTALFEKPLPAPNYNQYRAARQAGKDAKTAVAETFGKTLRETAVKQPPKERPRTPDGNNGGGGVKRPGPNATLDELVAYQLATGTKERF